jgi:hypothetical protein
MSKITSYLGLLVIALISMSSCSNNLKYFTQDLYHENRWSDSELERIQFYVSEDVILQRKLSGESSKITDGKIRIVDGSKIEEVIIKAGTPGILIDTPERDKFVVSFDSDDESKYLVFGASPKANGRYVLLAKEWKRRYGEVTYGNRIYETSTASAYAALQVDLKEARRVSVRSNKARGNRIE